MPFYKGHSDLVPVEARKRAAEKMKGNKHTLGFRHNIETLKIIGKKSKERWADYKYKNKLKEIHKKLGTGKWMLGKKLSEITKNKLKQIAKERGFGKWMKEKYCGKNNPNWRGGTSFEPYSPDWTETLKISIRQRDHYICKLCFNYGKIVHHIDYNKKNCNPDNLIILCRSCHSKTNNNHNHWINYFKINLLKQYA